MSQDTLQAPSEYQRHLTNKANEWRTKYPTRADALRKNVAKLLGYRVSHKVSETMLAAMTAPAEETLIAAMLGWPTEEEWKPDY